MSVKLSVKLYEKFIELENEFKNYFVERDDHVHCSIIALIARKHMVLLGPPGGSKSMAISCLLGQITGAKIFKYLLTRYTTPEEIHGQYSIPGLKVDKFFRVTAGKMPTVDYVILDEIFKGSSSILNANLTILNEREFYNNGHDPKVPLRTCFGTSNEMPESEELRALWDRIPLRLTTPYPKEPASWLKLLSQGDPKFETKFALEEIDQASDISLAMNIPKDVDEKIVNIIRELHENGMAVSPRRARESRTILQAEAFMLGKTEVDEDCLDILQHVYWNDPKEIKPVRNIILTITNPLGQQFITLYEEAQELRNNVFNKKKNEDSTDEQRNNGAIEANKKLKNIHVSMKELCKQIKNKGKPIGRYEKMLDDIVVMQSDILTNCLGIEMPVS